MVWERINHPVLEVETREVMFMLAHDILPTKERLLRLGMVDSDACYEGDGRETLEHLFCACRRVQEAWEWIRWKVDINGLALPGTSDLALLRLAAEGINDQGAVKNLVWLISTYVSYVWQT